jgi:hypothetical protein
MSCESLASPIEDRERGTTPMWDSDRKNRLSALNGPSCESMPSKAFRLGLALRRCGDAEEAEAFFSWSRRLMAERYIADRIVTRDCFRRHAAPATESVVD